LFYDDLKKVKTGTLRAYNIAILIYRIVADEKMQNQGNKKENEQAHKEMLPINA
jgi:hypothetical protein